MKNVGFSLIGTVLATVLVTVSILYWIKSSVDSRNQQVVQKHSLVASLYASELLELFRSHKSDRLKTILSKHPTHSLAAPYPLCAHINLLDRKSGKILNADPIAELPEGNLLDGATLQTRANRYYQVQVVNIKGDASNDAITVNPGACVKTAKDITLSGRTPAAGESFTLTSDERLMVTVGVSWFPKGKKEPQQVVISTVLIQ